MPADASIFALVNQHPVQVADPLEQYGKMISIKSMMGNEALNELQRQSAQRGLEQDVALQNLYAGASPEQISAPDFYRKLIATGGQKGAALAKTLVEGETARANLKKTQVQTHGEQVKQLRDMTARASTDADLASLRDEAVKLYGPNATLNIPQTVSDPNFKAWQQKEVMDADKFITQANQDRTFDETKRHHGETEKQATAVAAETKRYHDAQIGTPPNSNDPDYNTQVNYWASVVRKGGALPPGLARGPGGGAFVREVTKRAAVGDVPPEEMMANQARFVGEKAGQRTLGTRTANIEMAATEAASLADLAKQASAKVDRTQYKAFNDVIQAGQRATASPELRAFTASNTSLINAYARAINPQGVGTVADKEHAREMLSTAFSKGDYEAAIDQLMKEIDAARKSPGTVQKEMRDRFTGKEPNEPSKQGGGQTSSGGIKFLGWEN